MRIPPAVLVLLPAAGLWALPAAAAVTVTFAEPDRFTDTEDSSRTSKSTLREIERHLKQLGDRYLPPQETLRIEILDVDLAGRSRMTGRTTTDLRVLNGKADWPRIKVRYTLESGGSVSAPTEETITDMDYLRRPDPRYSDGLPYEKRMLDEWFRARFNPRQRE